MTMRKKRKFKSIISTFLCLALLGGAVFGVTKLFGKDNNTVKIGNGAFEIGGIDAQGKYEENEQALYTKEMFECQGLKVELDFDVNTSYQIFYYNYSGDFISSSDVLTKSFNGELPERTVYARIMITPEIPEDKTTEDFKINFFTKHSYLKGITITVAAEQNVPCAIDEIKEDLEFYLDDDGSLVERSSKVYHTAVVFEADTCDHLIVNRGNNDITVFIETENDYTSFVVKAGCSLEFYPNNYFDKDFSGSLYIVFNSSDPSPLLYI